MIARLSLGKWGRWQRAKRTGIYPWCYSILGPHSYSVQKKPPPSPARGQALTCLATITTGLPEQGPVKKKQNKNQKGISLHSLWPKGASFLSLQTRKRGLFGSLYLHLVCSSGFLDTSENTSGDSRGSGGGETENHGCFHGILNSAFLLPFTC